MASLLAHSFFQKFSHYLFAIFLHDRIGDRFVCVSVNNALCIFVNDFETCVQLDRVSLFRARKVECHVDYFKVVGAPH